MVRDKTPDKDVPRNSDLPLCRHCDDPAEKVKKCCTAHLALNRQRISEYRASRKRRGLCTRCSNPARPGGLLCEDHRREVTEKEQPRDKYPLCELCLQDRAISHPRYCKTCSATGLQRESAARLTRRSSAERCTHCSIWGHSPKDCRKLHPELPPRASRNALAVCGADESVETSGLREPYGVKPGDVLVYIMRDYSTYLPHAKRLDESLCVQYGGRVRVVQRRTGSPIKVEAVTHETLGHFYFRGSPKGWRVLSSSPPATEV